jgi:His/Glu/Gln/Arg/opine family amino acid ABC transporter permease subunit
MYIMRWEVVGENLPKLLAGLALGLEVALGSILIGAVIGLLAAFARTSSNPVVHRAVAGYVGFVRNLPLLLIIFFVYYGLPQFGIRFLDNIGSLVLALAVYSGAYLTEIFRAGILAVSKGFQEAGKAIGMTQLQIARFVTIPVMFRIVLPSLSNTLISLFKDTSLGAAIAVPELTYAGMVLNTNTWRILESWSAIGAMYLVTCYAMAFVMRRVEHHYATWA